MTYITYKTNNKGGYENLVVYWLAMTIQDLTVIFCDRFIDKRSRTHDQMVQAARSGKQNIVEASLEKSVESNIKLTGVARASFAELLEDYKDYLRQKDLLLWDKEDFRIKEIRYTKDLKDMTYKSYKTYTTYIDNAESFSNLMVTLCFKEGFLLDRLLAAQEDKFVREGGFRENLFKKRMEFKNSQKD